MSDEAISRRPLWHTPLRDLARGRVTGRLDWRGRLVAANLPTAAADLVARVVRRTRLSRIEKALVADELIAHFADGLAGGGSSDDLLRDFGDERAAARLIRRATIRKRPLAWHAFKWTRRVLLAIVAFYAVVFARFFLARPTVSVDYIAQLNAPILAVPADQRAWPLYRQAMLALGLGEQHRASPPASISAHPLFQLIDPDGDRGRDVVDATPADAAAWATLVAWLDAHGDGLTKLRAATTRPALGFVLGNNGSAVDPDLGWQPRVTADAVPPVVSISLPDLYAMRQLAQLLAADARVATTRGDGARIVSDIDAMLGIARHELDPLLVTCGAGIANDHLAFDAIARVLRESPTVLSNAQLLALARRVAVVGSDAPASLLDLSGERWFFRDVIQRIYSDDGHGDGVLTSAAIAAMKTYAPLGLDPQNSKMTFEIAAAAPLTSTRRAVIDENDRLMDLMAARFARPLRETTNADGPARRVEDRLGEIRASPLLRAKLLPVLMLTASVDRAAWIAERTLGRREGIEVGLTLELYRRRHGAYPATLDALVPDPLPRVPADRITGEPVKYRLIDGRPVVYSVGVDRDDDGGRAYIDKADGPKPAATAEWPVDSSAPAKDGDWILYAGRPTTRPVEWPHL